MVMIPLLASTRGRAGRFAQRLTGWVRPTALPCQTAALGVECAWPSERPTDAADLLVPHEDAPVIAEPVATANTLSLEASDDWDLMYRAVLGRLAAAAQAPPSRAAPHLRGAAAAQLRAVLQDCAEAMAWLVDASGHDRHSDR